MSNHPSATRDAAKRMAAAAAALLDNLSPDQRSVVEIDFATADERTNWHYIPRPRRGLSIKKMDRSQRELTLKLVATGLSDAAAQRAKTIMELETILAEIEGSGGQHIRDPEGYFISIFGAVGDDEPWGWRFEGHHVSLNNTIVDGAVSAAPNFFGANPAHVRHGERKGLRALAQEEDVARSLLTDLDGEQRRTAIVSDEAPADIITRNAPYVRESLEPPGLAGGDMTASQRQTLKELVAVYVERQPMPLAQQQLASLSNEALARITFAWAGATESGKGHYYRVQGSAFLAEYDNTQNDANHIHAVWHDLPSDFGEDLLQAHYQSRHR